MCDDGLVVVCGVDMIRRSEDAANANQIRRPRGRLIICNEEEDEEVVDGPFRCTIIL